jgi:hypothetical protein
MREFQRKKGQLEEHAAGGRTTNRRTHFPCSIYEVGRWRHKRGRKLGRPLLEYRRIGYGGEKEGKRERGGG